jgi:undecaprenyl-diphosphatase
VTILQSILLGAMQGITEFLPISSSAHLIALPWLFKIGGAGIDKIIFDVMVHFGTAFALIAVYAGKILYICKQDINRMLLGDFKDSTLLKIALGTIPAIVAGLFFKNVIEYYLRTPYICVFSLAIVSVFMMVAERMHWENERISYLFALLIGVGQALALVPGVSRSGITITLGIFLGLRRKEAVDFAFLLSIPIVFGVAFYESRHISFLDGINGTTYLVGALSAFLSGVLSLSFLIAYLRKHRLDVFAYYRIALAVLILVFVAIRS